VHRSDLLLERDEKQRCATLAVRSDLPRSVPRLELHGSAQSLRRRGTPGALACSNQSDAFQKTYPCNLAPSFVIAINT
jgi:hypothetical protein